MNNVLGYFHEGQTSDVCPTGVQYESSWNEGIDAGPFKMVDRLKVPELIESGEYMLSWRWDCEETPQVWNSCADITIV